jgi:hypothetical protein
MSLGGNMEFNNGIIEIWTKNEAKGIFSMCVKNNRYAYQINQVLHHYPKGTRFIKGDEPVFNFTLAQIKNMPNRPHSIGRMLARIIK